MYPGKVSTDWVKSSQRREDGYSKTVPTILTSIDVLESGEFNKMKIYREYDLLNRSINYMNRCGTHK